MAVKKVLRGTTVMLRPMVEQDLTTRAHWLLDPEIRQSLGLPDRPSYTYQTALADSHRWLSDRKSSGDLLWAIDVDGKLIGDVTAHITDFERKGEMVISIGDKAMWGKGYGKEACSLVLDEMFRESEIYYVDTYVVLGNNRSFSLALSLGFTPVGTQTGGTRVLRLIRKAWMARRKAELAS